MTIRRTLLAASLAFSATLLAPPRPALASDDDVLAAVFAQQAEADGDWEAWLGALVDAVARDPESPYALAALRKIAALQASSSHPEVIEKKLAAVVEKGVKDGEIDETLRGLLAGRAAARGDFEAAEKLGAARGLLTRFAAVGPFGWSSPVLVHRRYGPEDAVLDPKAEFEGTRTKVRWKALPVADDGSIDPAEHLRNGGSGVTYSVARVKSAKTQSVALRAACADNFKVVVNGREVITADRQREFVPARVWADVTLVEGWNRILVKTTGRSPFSVKLCDPATGQPATGLEEGEPLEAGPHPAAGPVPAPRTWTTPTERALAAANGSPSALQAAAGAFLAGSEGRLWDAYDAWTKAAAASAPGPAATANVQAAYGRMLADFDPFPPVQRKLRAKKAYEAAVAASPNHASARVRLAEFENQDDHPDKAVKALQALAAAKPSAAAYMGIARIARARGWEKEALDAARSALELQPAAGDAIDMLMDMDRDAGNFEAVRKRHERLLELDRGNRGAANAIVGHLRAQGKHEDALKLLREYAARWPDEDGWRRQVADTLRALSRDAEALAAYRELEKELPDEEAFPRVIAELLEVQGDTAGAKAAYEKSLAIESFQPAVRRAIARLAGAEEDFAAGWEPDAADILAKLPTTDELKAKYPKASAITVLDHTVTQVHTDGTAQSYVHMIYKVLDEKGVQKYENLPNRGELLSVKAILPDGRVFAPTGLAGSNYNIEGLVPGTILEQRYTDHDASSPRGYSGSKFFFQDYDFDDPNPVFLSRLVVLTPDALKLAPEARNFGGDPRVEAKDGWTATIWEKRDVPRIDKEENMPDAEEILPLVDYALDERFDDMPWQLSSQRPDTRTTPFVRDALAQCVKDGMSDTEKVRAIHDWVNKEITGDAGSASGPTAVLLDKSGNRPLLMESMIRAAGVPYRAGRAMPWNGVGARLADAGSSAFQGPFLWIEPRGGEPFPFFVGAHYAPFGLVPEAYRDSVAFVLSERGGEIRKLPPRSEPVDNLNRFAIRLAGPGQDAVVEATLLFRSPSAYGAKRSQLETPEDDRRKYAERQLAQFFASPKLTSYEMPRLDVRGAPFELKMTGTMSTYLTQQGDAWVAALGLPPANFTQRFVDRTDRQYDVVLRQRDDRVDEIAIDLGDAFTVKSLPQDHTAVHDVGTYSLTWRHDRSADANVIRVRREYHLHPARYRADEYRRFTEWCKDVDDAERVKLELRSAR